MFRKKAHSGAHSWHIRAHSGTFGHIRANLEISGCEPDLQKPMFYVRVAGEVAHSPHAPLLFYNIKKGAWGAMQKALAPTGF